jgi:hypothetical protein
MMAGSRLRFGPPDKRVPVSAIQLNILLKIRRLASIKLKERRKIGTVYQFP